jgi:ATP adenylyltransferase/5',5'''-P-1,P-4-tetraphosphate phosphorylase II
MQIFRAPEGFSLWPDEEKGAALPFRYFMARFEGLPEPEELQRAYEGLLRQAGEALGWDSQDREGEAAPHNVVLDGRWMVVVPRRASGWNGADANAAAMLGMVWVSDEERMGRWVELGPGRVMAALGVPIEDLGDAGM